MYRARPPWGHGRLVRASRRGLDARDGCPKNLKPQISNSLFCDDVDDGHNVGDVHFRVLIHVGIAVGGGSRYIPDGYTHKCLHVTLSALKPNPQGLGLNVDYGKDWLEANEYALTANNEGIYKKLNDVSVWQLMDLHKRLLTKHHETFWIDVDTRIIQDHEYFRVTTIDHTKNPIPSQFDILLEQGRITVDFLLCRHSGGDTCSFKVGKKDRALLFPESETYIINAI